MWHVYFTATSATQTTEVTATYSPDSITSTLSAAEPGPFTVTQS